MPVLSPLTSAPLLTWAGASDLGSKRQGNEDAWGVFDLSQHRFAASVATVGLSGRGLLWVLSDGMGGALAGEVASRFCVERLAAAVAAHSGWNRPEKTVRRALLATHAALVKEGRKRAEWQGMGATLSVLWVLPDGRFVIGHVGDSRIYYRRGGALEQITEDHTVGAGMVRRGEITPEAAQKLKFRALLEQAMGGDGAPIAPQVVQGRWQAGDGFVLCSDGLYGPLGDRAADALSQALDESGVEDVRRLIAAANAAGGPDNITVVLLRITALENL